MNLIVVCPLREWNWRWMTTFGSEFFLFTFRFNWILDLVVVESTTIYFLSFTEFKRLIFNLWNPRSIASSRLHFLHFDLPFLALADGTTTRSVYVIARARAFHFERFSKVECQGITFSSIWLWSFISHRMSRAKHKEKRIRPSFLWFYFFLHFFLYFFCEIGNSEDVNFLYFKWGIRFNPPRMFVSRAHSTWRWMKNEPIFSSQFFFLFVDVFSFSSFIICS